MPRESKNQKDNFEDEVDLLLAMAKEATARQIDEFLAGAEEQKRKAKQ